ncbi:DUF4132 domain-containing protein [Nocardia sp. 2]|uniref:DUF4132 domain-containing protein n=1 Tax=Nocardia acididurans TaxID=2802282 RepID=A0ABS1M2R1_9NOCA|nr:DUF4132 domain-containing protein [Nocardia acididurans]MBL1074806.1 DUF4132 domain-containing protein [Nocardia acididurans]
MVDENAWSLPAPWWEQAEPFRGRNRARPQPLRPNATAEVRQALIRRGHVDTVLTAARADGLHDLADATQTYVDALSSTPAAARRAATVPAHEQSPAEPRTAAVTPPGAAAALAIARAFASPTMLEWEARREFDEVFVDSWILEYGLVFAAEAVVSLRGFKVQSRRPQQGRMTEWLQLAQPGELLITGYDHAAQRVRAILSDATEAAYLNVVERLSELRSAPGTVWARLAASYLVPERQDWVDADLALEGLPKEQVVRMLASALTTPEQLTRYREIVGRIQYGPITQWYNLLTQVGPAAVAPLAEELTETPDHLPDNIKLLAGLLARIPTDNAYQALLDKIDDKRVLPALNKATTEFPRRALRLLSQEAVAATDSLGSTPRKNASAPLIIRTLQLHALAHPKLVAEEVNSDALPLLELAREFPEADPATLPAALTAPPARKPKLPRWLPPTLLPQIRLRDSATALPESAVALVITMLMHADAGKAQPDPTTTPDRDRSASVTELGEIPPEAAGCADAGRSDLAVVAALADPDSLAEFAWAVFDSWRLAAYPAKNSWVMQALGLWGTADTVRRLVPFITAWPGRSASARAVEGLSVLATIGGEVALANLHAIARKSKHASLRKKAEATIEEIGRALDLSEEELTDHAVPRLGLSADSTRTLDYGPRQFRVGLDPHLKPSVTTEGSRLRTLPKPSATDNPALAATSYQAYRDFANELKTVTTDQIRRFESAMVDGRRWRASSHRRLVIEHPVLGQLARRLVWAVYPVDVSTAAAEGASSTVGQAVPAAFRIDDDGSLADVEDNRFELSEDALVGIAHPLHLGEDLDRWRVLFADYELLQPFEQLDRGVYRFTAEEAASDQLSRFENRVAPTGRLYGLRQHGWELSYGDVSLPVGVLRRVRVNLDPGIQGGYRYEAERQRIVSVRINGGRFDAFDAVAASELLRQLERLTA